jgi:hypothetical protein
MTRAACSAVVLAAVALGATCGHANRPCPKPRPFAARAPTRAPGDAPTIAAVEATGARYQVCSGGTTYRIDRAGARPLTEAELRELKHALYSSTPGREMAGIGGVTCPPAKPDLGVMLWIRESTASPVMIAERVAALAARAGGDPTVHVQVEIKSAPGARCAPDDPACGPVPYEAACVEQTDYHPRGKREIVRARPGRGPCAYDGECRVGGCGNECVPTSAIDHAGTCEGYAGWDNVYCGCVEKKCVWFTTTL